MHAYNNDLDDYEWFIRGDDDSYIVGPSLAQQHAPRNPPCPPAYMGRAVFKIAQHLFAGHSA